MSGLAVTEWARQRELTGGENDGFRVVDTEGRAGVSCGAADPSGWAAGGRSKESSSLGWTIWIYVVAVAVDDDMVMKPTQRCEVVWVV